MANPEVDIITLRRTALEHSISERTLRKALQLGAEAIKGLAGERARAAVQQIRAHQELRKAA